jgi:ABC-type transporter Mla MlaB component
MEPNIERQGDFTRIGAPLEMTIYRIAEIMPAMVNTLMQATEVEVMLDRVSEIDTAGCQLLMLLKREADAAGKGLRFTGHSPAVLEAWDTYDLAGYFGDPLVLAKDEE